MRARFTNGLLVMTSLYTSVCPPRPKTQNSLPPPPPPPQNNIKYKVFYLCYITCYSTNGIEREKKLIYPFDRSHRAPVRQAGEPAARPAHGLLEDAPNAGGGCIRQSPRRAQLRGHVRRFVREAQRAEHDLVLRKGTEEKEAF